MNQKYPFIDQLQKMRENNIIDANEYQEMLEKYQAYINQIETPKKISPVPIIKQTQERKHKPIKDINLNILFTIGIILILFSSFILIASTWQSLSNYGKLISLFVFDLFIFFACFIVYRFLKLPKTAYAFWNLGVFIIPVIIYATGYFGLINNYLSFDGEGKYLYLAISFSLLLPLLIYSLKKYHSIFYLVICIINLFWIGIALSNHFHLKFQEILFVLGLVILGVIYLIKYITPSVMINKSTLIVQIFLYIYLGFIILVSPFIMINKGIFTVLTYLLAIVNLSSLFYKTKKNHFTLILSILSYFFLISLYLSFKKYYPLEYSLSLHNLFVVSIMFMIHFILLKLDKFRMANLLSMAISAIILFLNILLLFVPFHGLISFFSGYGIFLIIVIYLYLGKDKRLRTVFKYLSLPAFLLANLSSYFLISTYASRLFLDAYTPIHILLCIFISTIPYLITPKFEEEHFSFFSYFLSLLIIILAFQNNEIQFNHFPTSAIILYGVLALLFIGLIITSINRKKDFQEYQDYMRIFSFTLIFIILRRVDIVYSDFFNLKSSLTNLIHIGITAGFVGIAFLKTSYQKILLYTSSITVLASAYTLFLMSVLQEGFMPVLLLFIICSTCLSINLKRFKHLRLANYSIILLYLLPLLDVSFYINYQLYAIIIGILFYVLNLTNAFSLIQIEDNRISLKKVKNNSITYLSYGLMLILIFFSAFKADTHTTMIVVTLFLPLSFLILAFNEDNLKVKKLANSGIILSCLIPYWFFLTLFKIQTEHILEFKLIPLMLGVVAVYHLFYRQSKRGIYSLMLLVTIPLIVLLINYGVYGLILNGVILVMLTIVFVLFGFFIKNLTIFLNGIIGLIATVFIIISHVWQDTPWWLYLLISGLLIVAIAGYNEYSKKQLNKR